MRSFCANCGAPVEEGAAFCGSCGAPVQNAVEPMQPAMAAEPKALMLAWTMTLAREMTEF